MSASSMRKKSFARSSKPRVRMCVREQSLITMSSPQPCWPVPMRAIGAQNLLTMPGGVSSAGYLHKKGGSQFSLMKWPLRYIILHKGCLYYFKSSTSPAPQGAFSLNGYNRVMRAAEETTSSNVFPFKIVHFSKRHRTWFFSAASEDERRKWMRYLRREIDHYNDRKDSIMPSDIDSDTDSFYGTIERPMDITHLDSNADDDYIEEDDDEDEEDYLKPDDNCSLASTAGRPAGPPPAYPPPPVPASFQLRQDCVAGFYKAPPPPPPIPTHHRIPTSPLPPKPLPCLLPPPIPKGPCKGPPPPPPNPQRPQGRALFSGDAKRDWRPLSAIASQSPATLPICDQLETRLVLNGPEHCSLNPGGSQSLGNHHQLHSKPSQMTHHPANTGGSNVRPVTAESLHPSSCHPLLPGHPPPVVPKPPQPAPKSPLPAPKTKPPGGLLQRSSPEGQSFRSPGDEVPPEFRRKQGPTKRGGGDDSEKSMQLPDSVFINTTETSFVERLFREGPAPLEDGLYGIRKSGTKTSKVLVVWDVSIGKARNYRLFEDDDRVFLDSEVTFPTLSTLIEHYHSHPLPHHGSLCLQKPFT